MAALAALTTLAAMAGATEWLVRSTVAPQDSWLPHLRLVQAPGSRDLAFGDSHVARGFAAPSPWINLAYPSSTIEEMAATVARVMTDGGPRRVILQADPHLFAPYRLRRNLGAYEETLAGDPAGEPFPLLADARHRPLLASYWSSFLAQGGTLQSRIEQTPRGALLSPGNLAEVAPRRLVYEALQRARIHQPFSGFRTQPAAGLYRETVEALVSAGAEVCMVAFPVSAPYSAALIETDPNGGADSYAQALAWFAETAGTLGARFVDHRGAVTDMTLFRDVDHLNRDGALAYVERLLEACFGDRPAATLSASRD